MQGHAVHSSLECIQEDVVLFLATYNEAENVAVIYKRLREVLPEKVRIVIIDDNSPDGTWKIAKDMVAGDGYAEVVVREKKDGLGAALCCAYEMGLASGARYICTMDADLSHDPAVLPALINKCIDTDAGLAIGTRWAKGGGIIDLELHRVVISKFGNWLVNVLLDVPYHDCTSNFRCYHRDCLETIRKSMWGFQKKYGFLAEAVYQLHVNGAKIVEHPIIFVNRQYGKTKVSGEELVMALANLFRLFVKRVARSLLRSS